MNYNIFIKDVSRGMTIYLPEGKKGQKRWFVGNILINEPEVVGLLVQENGTAKRFFSLPNAIVRVEKPHVKTVRVEDIKPRDKLADKHPRFPECVFEVANIRRAKFREDRQMISVECQSQHESGLVCVNFFHEPGTKVRIYQTVNPFGYSSEAMLASRAQDWSNNEEVNTLRYIQH